MKKIIPILFKYLRAEAHLQVLTLFNQLLNEFPAVLSIVTLFYEEFTNLLAQEKKIVYAGRKIVTFHMVKPQ